MVTLLGGLVGGLLATIVMTAFMMTMGDDSPPPPALVLSKISGGTPEQYRKPGMMVHLLYGIGAGVVFALLGVLGLYAIGDSSSLGLVTGVVNGLVYGIILFVIFAVVWMKGVLGTSPERKRAGAVLFFHLVYGVVLGAFLGLNVL